MISRREFRLRHIVGTMAARWAGVAVACSVLGCAPSMPKVDPAPTPKSPAAVATPAAPSPRLTRISSVLDTDAAPIGAYPTLCVSGDGRFVAFLGMTKHPRSGGGGRDVLLFIYDVAEQRARRVTPEFDGATLSLDPTELGISGDGHWIVFLTDSMLPDVGPAQLFAFNWRDGTVLPLDVHRDGIAPSEVPVSFAVSNDLNTIVVALRSTEFKSGGSLLIDRESEHTRMLDTGHGCLAWQPSISADGRFVAFLQRGNCDDDSTDRTQSLWLHDVQLNDYERIDLEDLADEQASDRLVRIEAPCVSQAGRFVTLLGSPTPPGLRSPQSVLVYDRSKEVVFVASQGYDGQPADGMSFGADLSEGATCVAFVSGTSNLVAGDANESSDVFLYDLRSERTECLSVNAQGATGNAASMDVDMSDDGQVVAFMSLASDLVSDDRGMGDIFLWQR